MQGGRLPGRIHGAQGGQGAPRLALSLHCCGAAAARAGWLNGPGCCPSAHAVAADATTPAAACCCCCCWPWPARARPRSHRSTPCRAPTPRPPARRWRRASCWRGRCGGWWTWRTRAWCPCCSRWGALGAGWGGWGGWAGLEAARWPGPAARGGVGLLAWAGACQICGMRLGAPPCRQGAPLTPPGGPPSPPPLPPPAGQVRRPAPHVQPVPPRGRRA